MVGRYVVDTQGRVWRRCAIPEGITLANGESVERIKEQNRKRRLKAKEQERRAKEKARRKAKAKREQARKEWEERPQILYTPMGNKR